MLLLISLMLTIAVPVTGIITDLPCADIQNSLFPRSADYTVAQDSLHHIREKGQYINPHRQKYLSAV